MLIGVVLLGVMWVVNNSRGKEQQWDWVGGLWYIPWLGGLALMSYIGNYDGGTNVLGFESAFVVTFIFSGLIMALAYYTRLSPEQVHIYIEHSQQEAALEEQELGATP